MAKRVRFLPFYKHIGIDFLLMLKFMNIEEENNEKIYCFY